MAGVRPSGHLQVKGEPGDDDLVFATPIGKPPDDSALRRRYYDALEAAGLGALRRKADPLVFHDLRHTFGTLAVQAFPLSDVKAYMGHAAFTRATAGRSAGGASGRRRAVESTRDRLLLGRAVGSRAGAR